MMSHNVLVLDSLGASSAPSERRDLGLPARVPGGVIAVRVEGLAPRQAAALTAAMRAAGGAAARAPSRPADRLLARLGAPGPGGAVALFGDREALRRLPRRLARTHPVAAAEIESAVEAAERRPRLVRLGGRRLRLGGAPRVMGILNVTPDSFSDGGRYVEVRAAVSHGLRLADEGADLIDVGGESTRPGSRPVGLEEELRRVEPVLRALVPALRRRPGGGPAVSIDTTKAEVARRAAALGADLLNDVSGMTFDAAMPATVAECGLGVVLQHLRTRPAVMQRRPRYTQLMPEVAAHLRVLVERARRAGIDEDRILVDPGLGFGKTRSHNLALLRHLPVLRSLGRPILVGASRKSFLRDGLERSPRERLAASLAAEALALAGGADIIRVHDVRQAVRAARLCDAVLRRAPDGS